MCAAGSLPGDLHKLWRARDPAGKGYHVEYGFSCMGYEIPGGIGVSLAAPDRVVYVMVGDGSYLMLPGELVTAVAERVAIVLVLVENHGYASIGALSRSVGGAGFGTHHRAARSSAAALDAPAGDALAAAAEALPVDLAANVETLGVPVTRVGTREQLAVALAATADPRGPVAIYVETDRYAGVPNYDGWWDVPVAAAVRPARGAGRARGVRAGAHAAAQLPGAGDERAARSHPLSGPRRGRDRRADAAGGRLDLRRLRGPRARRGRDGRARARRARAVRRGRRRGARRALRARRVARARRPRDAVRRSARRRLPAAGRRGVGRRPTAARRSPVLGAGRGGRRGARAAGRRAVDAETPRLRRARAVVNNILMGDEAAERLLVCEVVTPSGHWSSYPPHKHDRDALPDESLLEETYYHRASPPSGFALQRVYSDDRELDETLAVHDRDLVLVPRGYHAVAAPPGVRRLLPQRHGRDPAAAGHSSTTRRSPGRARPAPRPTCRSRRSRCPMSTPTTVRTLQNYVGGAWTPATRRPSALDVDEPGDRGGAGAGAAVERAPTSTPPSQAARAALPAWRDVSVIEPREPPVRAARGARRTPRGPRALGHGRDGQDARRRPRRGRRADRDGRGRVRDPDDDAGPRSSRTSRAASTPRRSASRSACARRSRRSTSRRWCRSGSCRSRSRAATRSSSSRPSRSR